MAPQSPIASATTDSQAPTVAPPCALEPATARAMVAVTQTPCNAHVKRAGTAMAVLFPTARMTAPVTESAPSMAVSATSASHHLTAQESHARWHARDMAFAMMRASVSVKRPGLATVASNHSAHGVALATAPAMRRLWRAHAHLQTVTSAGEAQTVLHALASTTVMAMEYVTTQTPTRTQYASARRVGLVRLAARRALTAALGTARA